MLGHRAPRTSSKHRAEECFGARHVLENIQELSLDRPSEQPHAGRFAETPRSV
jgi:hypothetical protein